MNLMISIAYLEVILACVFLYQSADASQALVFDANKYVQTAGMVGFRGLRGLDFNVATK